MRSGEAWYRPGMRSSMSPRKATLACAGLLAAALLSQPASAQTDDERAGARAAATDGAQAFKEKRWADAIDLFARAEAVLHAPPHVLFMARANVNLGRLINAREQYMKLSRETLAADAPAPFREAVQSARTELAELEARIPFVTVTVEGGSPPGLKVLQDGVVIPPSLVGLPRPTDPGKREFRAVGDTLESAPVVVMVEEGKRSSVVLKLEPKKAVTPASAPPGAEPAAVTAAGGGAATSKPYEQRGSGGDSMRWVAYGAFGVGAIGLVGGTIFTLKSSSKRSDADDLAAQICNGADCDGTPAQRDDLETLDSDASSAGTLGVVGFVVGGVGVAAGVTLLLLGGGQSEAAASAPRVTPWVGLGSAGLSGRF